jgi:hypothetical protein
MSVARHAQRLVLAATLLAAAAACAAPTEPTAPDQPRVSARTDSTSNDSTGFGGGMPWH